MTTVIPPTIDIHLSGADLRDAMEQDVRRGLTARPKSLPPVYFYDDRGSRLFDEITRLPEYYPTRSERSILDAHAEDIAERSQADTLVELGPGRVRSHGSSSMPCGPPGTCAGSFPST